MKLLIILLSIPLLCLGQETYKIDCTTYYKDSCYSHGGNMVKRSTKNKKEFLKLKGYDKCPAGYEIGHIIPLSRGGTDCPDNMQLLTVAEHRKKTANERKKVTLKTN